MKIAPVVAIGLLVIAALIVGFNGGVSLPLNEAILTILGQHLLTLAFLALLIERAVEVYLNNAYGKKELEVSRTLRVAQREVSIISAALDQELARTMPTLTGDEANRFSEQKVSEVARIRQLLFEAKKNKMAAETETLETRENLTIEKAASAATAATVLGAAISLVGVTTLSEVVSIDTTTVSSIQQKLFMAVDVSITALILAGGSDGIHQIIKRFTSIKDDFV